MYLEIITPDQKVFEGEITGVRVPGVKGSFEVLKDHAALVSPLEKGTYVSIKKARPSSSTSTAA
jgi:F-type H+-transporting ATPase subunit epsilon